MYPTNASFIMSQTIIARRTADQIHIGCFFSPFQCWYHVSRYHYKSYSVGFLRATLTLINFTLLIRFPAADIQVVQIGIVSRKRDSGFIQFAAGTYAQSYAAPLRTSTTTLLLLALLIVLWTSFSLREWRQRQPQPCGIIYKKQRLSHADDYSEEEV